mgnify:CR=1 FL=1
MSYAVIGASGNVDPGAGFGAAYLFRFNGSSWVEQAKLTAADVGVGDGFGRSVSASGGTVEVGAQHDDDGGTSSGSTYVFSNADLDADGVLTDCDNCPGAANPAQSDADGEVKHAGTQWQALQQAAGQCHGSEQHADDEHPEAKGHAPAPGCGQRRLSNS